MHTGMRLSGLERWAGLAMMGGGLLLLLFYAVVAGRFVRFLSATDAREGSTLGDPVHLPLMIMVTAAMLLLMLGIPGLLARQAGRVAWAGVAGASCAFAGFGLWAYAAAENFLPLPRPWWPELLFTVLVTVGAAGFAAAAIRAEVLPRRGALLVGIFGVLGLGLLAGADWAAWLLKVDLPGLRSPLVAMGGYLAMLPFAAGWVWLGYAILSETGEPRLTGATGRAMPAETT